MTDPRCTPPPWAKQVNQRLARRSAWTVALLVLSLVAGWGAPASVVFAQAAGGCTFVLGFADLRALVPTEVGACTDDERANPANGDAVQPTTRGLLVWRKADNWTAFTDGARTFVNGPLGLQQRLNGQRFWWEENGDNLPMVPPARAGERCHTAGLAVSLDGVDVGAGNLVGTFRLTNTQPVPCTLFGYVGLALRDGAGNALPTNAIRGGGGTFQQDPAPSVVTVQPGGFATFRVHWEQVPVGTETTCPTAAALAITPPDEFVSLVVATQIRACGGGRLDVGAVQAAPIGSAIQPTGTVSSVRIALIDTESGGGDVGCGDRVVLVDRAIPPTRAPLTAALSELLAGREARVGPSGLYNAFYRSDLRVVSATVQPDGRAVIRLDGVLRSGGVCDSPRLVAQVRETARQFSTVREVQVFVNDRPLADLLSER